MITQDEHTARHSPAGACVFPAGSDGVGGFFSCRGALETERDVVPPCRICLAYDKRGPRPSWALTLNEWGLWNCDRMVVHGGLNLRHKPAARISRADAGFRTA